MNMNISAYTYIRTHILIYARKLKYIRSYTHMDTHILKYRKNTVMHTHMH